MFVGADPSLGVAVIRQKLRQTMKKELDLFAVSETKEDELANLGEQDQIQDEEPALVEVSYATTRQNEDVDEGLGNKMTKLDVFDDQQREINLKVDTKKLKLKLNFYQEDLLNKLHMKFDYSFT